MSVSFSMGTLGFELKFTLQASVRGRGKQQKYHAGCGGGGIRYGTANTLEPKHPVLGI